MVLMQILGFLPGYMWANNTLKSTGVAIPPTQHIDPETGEVIYYVRPFFIAGLDSHAVWRTEDTDYQPEGGRR